MGQSPTWGQTTEGGGFEHETIDFVLPVRSRQAAVRTLPAMACLGLETTVKCSMGLAYSLLTPSLLLLQKHNGFITGDKDLLYV